MKKTKDSLCLTALLLAVIVWLDMICTGGALYRFVLTRIGVPEPFAAFSSLAIMVAYLLLEIGLAIHGRMKANIQN